MRHSPWTTVEKPLPRVVLMSAAGGGLCLAVLAVFGFWVTLELLLSGVILALPALELALVVGCSRGTSLEV